MADHASPPAIGVVVTTSVAPGERLASCLDALAASARTGPIVVVDNSGSDGEIPAPHDGVVHVRVPNHGFGAAANAGFAHPALDAVEHIALLNDDVIVDPDWLAPLLATLDAAGPDERIGAVQPMLVLADTDPPLVNSLGVELDRHGAGVDIAYRTPVADVDPTVRDIEIFTGGAVVFRRGFLDETGGFDDRLFLYYEDVDLALRGAERGWRYRCVPASRVVHTMGATTDALGDERTRLQERNRLLNAVRHAAPATVGRSLWLSVRRLRHRPRRVHLRALLGGIAGAPRAASERLRAARLSR